jgi:thioredoxin-related protein
MARCEAVSVKAADVGINGARFVLTSKWIKALLVILLIMGVSVQADVTKPDDTAKIAPSKVAPAKSTPPVLKWVPFDSVRATFPVALKPLFLFISQTGCDFCEYMDTAVFSRPEIIRFVNEKLTPVRVDIYKDTPIRVRDTVLTEPEFRKLLSIEGIPAYYFFGVDGRIIGVLDSQMDLLAFKRMLVYLGDGHFFKTRWNDFILMPSASEAEVNKRFEAK